MLHFLESLLIGRLRSKITRKKTPVLAIIFRVPMPSVSPYPQGGFIQRTSAAWVPTLGY